MDFEHLDKVVHVALLVPLTEPNSLFCTWGLPMIIWGLPGIGKSACVVMGGLKAGLTTKQIYAPRLMPDDPSGVAIPDGQGGVKIVCTMTAVRELKELGSGVLFIDELSSCKHATQASLLGVVLDRDVAGEVLPGRVRILAAANPPELSSNGQELMAAFANRLCHIHLDPPPADAWGDWLMKGSERKFLEVEKGEVVIKKNWDYAWGRARGIFSRGIRRNPGLLHNMPDADSGKRGTAWPSHRSWEFAARAYATCLALGYGPNISDILVEGCVGEAHATPLLEWIRAQDLPDPADVIDKGFTPDIRRIDQAFIVYNSVTEYVVNQEDKKVKLDMGIKLWKLFTEAESAGLLDTVIDCVKTAVSKNLGTKAHPSIKAIATPILERIGDAGLQELVT